MSKQGLKKKLHSVLINEEELLSKKTGLENDKIKAHRQRDSKGRFVAFNPQAPQGGFPHGQVKIQANVMERGKSVNGNLSEDDLLDVLRAVLLEI